MRDRWHWLGKPNPYRVAELIFWPLVGLTVIAVLVRIVEAIM